MQFFHEFMFKWMNNLQNDVYWETQQFLSKKEEVFTISIDS